MTRPACIVTVALMMVLSFAPSARGERVGRCSVRAPLSRAALTAALRRGGFTGVLDARAAVRRSGCIRQGDAELSFYHYSRVWANRRMTQRLLVVSSREGYLGMYAVDDPPTRVEGDRVVFPYAPARGNEIRVTAGRVPRTVWLDGEVETLFR